jgi:hypothetical protein
VKGDSGFLLAVDEHPVDGGAAPVLRQEGTVEIETSCRWNVEDRLAQKVPVVEREEDVRRQASDPLDPERMVDIVRRVDWNVSGCSQFGDRVEPPVFLRVVVMGKHGGDLEPVAKKGFDAHAADLVIGQNNRSHSLFSFYRADNDEDIE